MGVLRAGLHLLSLWCSAASAWCPSTTLPMKRLGEGEGETVGSEVGSLQEVHEGRMGILMLLEDREGEDERVEVLDRVAGRREAVAVDGVGDGNLARLAVEHDRALEVGENDEADHGFLAVRVLCEACPHLGTVSKGTGRRGMEWLTWPRRARAS